MISIDNISAQQVESQTQFNREDYLIFKDLNVDWYGEKSEPIQEETQNHRVVPLENIQYSELLKYYRTPIKYNRRGMEWWMVRDLTSSSIETTQDLEPVANRGKIRLSGSMEGYNVGLASSYDAQLNDNNALCSYLDLRTGRDLFVDGLFSNQLRSRVEWRHLFGESADDSHYFTASIYAPYINASQRNGVVDEIVDLTGNRFYNSAWGYYDGEVRSSRVNTYAIPTFEARYQRVLNQSTLAAEFKGRYGVSRRSQLEWYDAYNPYPDYYQNLPSYIQSSAVEQMWMSGDEEYTQINWADLVWSNELSSDGESRYVMASDVKRVADAELSLIASSELQKGFTIRYGAMGGYESNRCYKQLDDLLGGDYLLNTDQYIGDYEHLDMDMDNDLRNPNRKVVCGERFGYDYSLNTLDYSLLAGLNYSRSDLSIDLYCEFGSRYVQRVGHYEKERFAGDLSYGESSSITLAQGRYDYRASYRLDSRNELSLVGSFAYLPPMGYEVFIQPEYANLAITNPTSSKVNNISLRYDYHRVGLQMSAEVFYYRSTDGTDIVRYYDDLSYQYTNAVVSEISTRGVGVELSLAAQITQNLRLETTLSVGDYRYCNAPLVSLYEDVGLSLYSSSRANGVEGCVLGDTASIYSTFGLQYFTNGGWIIATHLAIGSGRYVDPSFVRRTDRVVSAMASSNLDDEVIEQSELANMYDLSLSVTKSLMLRNGNRISLQAKVDNLLGISTLEYSGRESNRVLYSAGGTTTGLRYLQPNSYTYSLPRRIYISCNYHF